MLKNLLCQIVGHKVNRRRVWHDRFNFRTSCDRCSAPLLRDRHQWRLFDTERDANLERAAHPHSAEAVGG